MEDEKIIDVCEKYEKYLNEFCTLDEDLKHVKWMTRQIAGFLTTGRKEKANRWLGFIQGVLCSKNIYTIEDMKNDNRSYVSK